MRTAKTIRFPVRLGAVPEQSGVYFFRDAHRVVLYVGKAVNLRSRIRSYLEATPGSKQERMLREATSLKVELTESDIEALVRESAYIKRYQPKYNTALKDDTRYFSLCFVPVKGAESYPRVWITHQPAKYRGAECVGPFVDGTALKRVMRMVRQYFPFCTCAGTHARMCLYAHLELCPGYCCMRGAAAAPRDIRTYARTLSYVKSIFKGENTKLAALLKKQITSSVRQEQYEDAARFKKQLEGLERIFSHQSVLESTRNDEPYEAALAWFEQHTASQRIERVEMVDTSMLQGSHRVGVLTVFQNRKFDKAEWRLFRIRNDRARDDVAMMREVLERRFSHPEWRYPDALFVDGGTAQAAVAREVLKKHNLRVPVCAVTKNDTHVAETLLVFKNKTAKRFRIASLPAEARNFALEFSLLTHRFAIGYFRARLARSFIV